LCDIADKMCNGRVLALGGGGYNRSNLAKAWNEVVSGLLG
jgi:acetoin utilization protein AcuC